MFDLPRTLSRPLAFVAALAAAGSAQAIVVDSLPVPASTVWTDIVFSGTSMVRGSAGTTLTTANDRGVWFGWMAGLGGNTPAWHPGVSSEGNHLSLTLSFSAGAVDWSAYMYDRSHQAAVLFRPSGCADNCYALTGAAGVDLLYADTAAPTVARWLFVPIADLEQPHQFEYLMKNGQVSYRIDGRVVYTGQAFDSSYSASLLVVGDGSGSTRTGKGSMTVHAVRLDTAPVAATLVSTVPEPGSWALMLAGGALLAARARRRR